MILYKKKILLLIIIFLLSAVCFYGFKKKNIKEKNVDSSEISQIKKGFLNPPPSALPGVYWYFMDGNLSKQGMTEDLESMKKAGIGNVVFLEVNVGVPQGKVDFLSEEWYDLFKHAIVLYFRGTYTSGMAIHRFCQKPIQ